MHTETVVLVEGESDRVAIEVLAARLGRSLVDEGVTVTPMGGATWVGRMAGAIEAAVRVVGLCDAGEEPYFRRALAAEDVFVCRRDLEDELIDSVGDDATEAIIEHAGELPSLRRLQNMPFHRGRPHRDQLRRFMSSRSGRKQRYAGLLAEAVALDRVPQPIAELLAHVAAPTTGPASRPR